MRNRAWIFALSVLASSLPLSAQYSPLGTEEQRAAGKALYDKNCAQCHGEAGDGLGVAAPYMKPQPRDFTRGRYKFRSTPTGVLPTDDDLMRMIRLGMPYTAMPAWPEFNDRQLTQLAFYLKTFSPAFAGLDSPPQAMDLPRPPSYSEESAERGEVIYEELGCSQCHGDLGRGDGPTAPTLTDEWGFHVRAANLTMPWTFRGGGTRADIYRTFMTGIGGTPMPSYADEGALAPDDRWPLVDYIWSLSGSSDPNYATLVQSVFHEGEIEPEAGPELFAEAPMARFPLFGQIVEPGRSFYPPASSVMVRSVYNLRRLAVLVEWDDMQADIGGSNSPLLRAPEFDPEEAVRMERIGGSSEDPSDPLDADPIEQDPFAADPFAQLDASDLAPGDTGRVRATEFSDAVAIQFPQRLPDGMVKPYFLFGDVTRPVELWFVDLAKKEPELFTARGSGAITEGEGDGFLVSAQYDRGRWSVVFVRNRVSSRSVSFREAQFVPIAFSVWDGFSHERGNKRALSNWFYLYVSPMERPSPLGPIVTNFFTVLLGIVLVVFWARRTYSAE